MKKIEKAKEFFSHNTYVADIFNSHFLNGEKIINPDELRVCKTTHIPDEEFEDILSAEKEILDMMPLLSQVENDECIFNILALRDPNLISTMGVQLTQFYEKMQYSKQWCILNYQNREIKLKPVITVVVNLSEHPWDIPLSLHELHELYHTIPKRYIKMTNDYGMHLLDSLLLSDEHLDQFYTDLGFVLKHIKHHNDEDYCLSKNERFYNLNQESIDFMSAF